MQNKIKKYKIDLKLSQKLEDLFKKYKKEINSLHITKYGMNDTKIKYNFEILIKCYKTLHKMTVWKSVTTYD